MKECYIFTFGIGHLMSKYAIKICDTYEGAREKMNEQFGSNWCSQYTVEEFERLKEEGHFADIKVISV